VSIELLENMYFIERGYLSANHFVYCSEKPVLIDSGYAADFETTETLISDMGVNLSEVDLIINTHCHCDHIGGNRIIQARSGCKIGLHPTGKHFIDTRDDWAIWWRYYGQQAEFFRCTQQLEDGSTVTIGPHRFEIIHTPGHAADGIVLYHRPSRILISSDTLWENDMAVLTLRVEGSAAVYNTQQSLKRLSGLKVDMVYPGHGQPFEGFEQALQRSLQRVAGYISNPRGIGRDLLKKITVYTLLMIKTLPADDFYDYLMQTIWFKETVDLYFKSAYETMYNETVSDLLDKKALLITDGVLSTTVKP